MKSRKWPRTLGAGALVVVTAITGLSCGSTASPSTPLPTATAVLVGEGTAEAPAEGGVSNYGTASEGAAADPAPEEADSEDEADSDVSGIRMYREFFFGAAIASIEERIFLADVIVRANLISASDGVLRFRAVEYLKGTGADEFSVSASTEGRDKQWDGQEAVLFLSLSSSGSSTGSTGASSYEFTDTTEFDYQPFNDIAATSYAGDLPQGYTVDSRNPVWLPLDASTGTGAKRAYSEASRFITASVSLFGAAYPTISLSGLRSKMSWVGGGAGIEGYDECIRASLDHMRHFRDWEAYHGAPFPLLQAEMRIASGVGSGEEVKRYDRGPWLGYASVWFTGPDAGLFSAQVVDDDKDPTNGFSTNITTARPLPVGTYRAIHRVQSHGFQPCDFLAPYHRREWVVTVTAPTGTVHEALFDPADLSPGIGFSLSAGVFEPAGFTFGDTATTVTGLKWEGGSVVLTLSPYVSLSGLVVDFIGLDGTTSLSLGVAAATADSAAGTLRWSVASQPWEAGDELMVRVRLDKL